LDRQIALAIDQGMATWVGAWHPHQLASAPGRIELLGNHVDYNGGPVLAAAIDRRTVVVCEPSGSQEIEVVLQVPGDRLRIRISAQRSWRNTRENQEPADYVRGVVAALLARGRPVRGGRFVVTGDVPIGVGVSSSASLCVALTLAFSREPLLPRELVLTAQDAEHRAGTPCGTMDQSASIAGGIIRYDGATLETRMLEPDLGDHAFLVIDSGVRRALAHSSYPQRVVECREALSLIRDRLGSSHEHLAQVTTAELAQAARDGDGDWEWLLFRRASHVVSEVARVEAGEAALREGDWTTFGRLMQESGQSSAGDYAISHPVVEDLVLRVGAIPGVLGARMMGGGEGGSLLALVRTAPTEQVEEMVRAEVNRDVESGAPPRQVFACSFSGPASLRPLSQT
jgi:galactokinase